MRSCSDASPRQRRARQVEETIMKSEPNRQDAPQRREFLRTTASTAAGLALAGCAGAEAAHRAEKAPAEHVEAEVTPGEDLMQEHGVLERNLLLYDEAAGRIDRGEPLELAAMTSAARIVRRFVEDYHEKLEEEFVFPRLESARREVELVTVLRRQHQRGREVTDEIVRLAAGGAPSSQLAAALRGFQRMVRPHAAREDTVLFPAFREVVGGAAYRELGEQFEEKEHALFGERGFQDTVAEVAELESQLGIADLSRFTAP
jgi:hemerythrin-like domain-containing protein